MTDNDIIKALELEAIYCRGEGNMYGPTKKTFVDAELIEGALALINRQKAEIERLEAENNRFADIGKMYSEIRAESVKEFAERLKQKETTAISCKRFEGVVSTDDIDNLVKEFTEGKAYEDK